MGCGQGLEILRSRGCLSASWPPTKLWTQTRLPGHPFLGTPAERLREGWEMKLGLQRPKDFLYSACPSTESQILMGHMQAWFHGVLGRRPRLGAQRPKGLLNFLCISTGAHIQMDLPGDCLPGVLAGDVGEGRGLALGAERLEYSLYVLWFPTESHIQVELPGCLFLEALSWGLQIGKGLRSEAQRSEDSLFALWFPRGLQVQRGLL